LVVVVIVLVVAVVVVVVVVVCLQPINIQANKLHKVVRNWIRSSVMRQIWVFSRYTYP
jgi:hypothetical protein